MCTKTKLHRLALLRELCKKTGKFLEAGGCLGFPTPFLSPPCLSDVCTNLGIQLLYRDYDFTDQPVFTEDDVIAMVPIVKHTDFRVGHVYVQ